MMSRLRTSVAVLATLAWLGAAGPATGGERNAREERGRPGDDASGRPQRGVASYHSSPEERPMANGQPFDAGSDSAAGRTLPLGTTARMANLEDGRKAIVEIEDRGPYVDGALPR